MTTNATNTIGQWVGAGYINNTTTFTKGVPSIGTSVYASSVVNGTYIKINGVSNTAATVNTSYGAINVQLGAAYNLGGGTNVNFFHGYMPEVIVYSSALSATEVTQVESYLAIKYGKTIAGDYLSSIGTNIWASGSGYHNNIAGIGRDDNSALLQKQSQSENNGFQPIIALGSIATTNAQNNSTALSAADRSFLIWGDNNASTAFATPISLNDFNNRMARVWRVQETGSVGSVVVAIPASAISNSITNLSLLQSASASFSTGVTSLPLTLQTINGSNYYTTTIDFTTGEFFTFGGLLLAPGGVTNNLVRWFKADKDITAVSGNVSQWVDQANAVIATQATASKQPTYNTSGSFLMNFNQSLTFSQASSDVMAFSEAGMSTGTATRAIFGVGASSTPTASPAVLVNQGTSGVGFCYGLSRSGSSTVPPDILRLSGTNLVTSGSTSVFSNRIPVIAYGGGPSGNLTLSYNGNPAATSTSAANSLSGPVFIGSRDANGSDTWEGDITEIIYYTAEPTAVEKQRIDSYLGLKYGVTLASDYLASDGLTYSWKLTDHTGYNNNIAGIGRDDNTALNQKQSKSANAGNQVVFSLDKLATTSGANSGSFTNDLQFLVWGDNGATGTSAFSTAPYTRRLNRVWKVVNTGGINQTLQVLVPTALFTASAKTALMYNTNSSFATGNILFAYTKTVSINGTYYFSYSLPAAQVNTGTFYISFVYYLAAPGGVLGESVWLRADAQGYGEGTPLDATTEWVATTGLSAGQYEAQYASGAKPVFKKGIWNFNPVVRFNLGGIGTDYANTGSAITTFTTVNNFGAVSGQGSPTSGEVRVLSMAGGTNADFGPGTGGFIPVIGGNPLRTFTNGPITSANFTTALNGNNPGIATSMRTASTAASGNSINMLYAQWNGGSPATIAASLPFSIDYYAVGGLADGSKTIRNTNSMFTGDVPEVIVYSNDLTATQRQRINSYLSLKYGVTLNQTVAQNYLASDGSTVYWNAIGAHATYKNNIAGIGMDNFTSLLQKQGQSIHKPGQVIVSLGTIAATNEENTGTFSADKQFLVWGDDNASASSTTAVSGFGTVGLRMLRKWELQNTGSFNQQVTVYYPTDTLAVAFGSNQYNLIYDNDATFNGTAKTSVLAGGSVTINGINYTAFTVTFPATGTLYFSFGTSNPSPMLTVGAAVCSGTATYSVTFNSNGTVTASAGTVSGNSVTGIPVGTNVTLTATSGVATTTAVVPSPASCPVSNGCTPPALTAGNGVCSGSGNYSIVFSATTGATITVSPGTATVSGNTVTAPVGTNVTITATLGGCSSSITVNSPADCSTACATSSASFSAGTCSGVNYSVNFVKTSTSVVTASTGTVTGGGAGSTSGTISGVATGTAIIATVTETGCSVQNITINAPSNTAPVLTASNAVCSGTSTYSVTFNSNGIVTASAGTVSGNSVTGIPVGTNVTLTARSTNGCGTTTSVVPSPASCPSTNGCTPPALTAGQGVCSGTGYSVAFSATSGASISISSGTLSGNTVTGVTLGTSLTITATLGGCSSVVTVNSPVDCSTACATPSASFSAGACAGATYSVNFVKTSGSVITASTGTVTGGSSGSTSGTISGVATGTAIIATVTEGLCSAQITTINAPSNTAPVLTASNAVCSGTGTYSVTFSSNGIVTASAGTVSGNTVTGIPVGTNVTLTARSTNGCGTTTAVVPSPASCPTTNGCTPPALTAGQGVCSGGGNYSVVFSATSGASIAISSGTLSGNTVTGVTLGTSLTITASLGGCSSVITVNSPADCNTACATPSASFSGGACTGTTYSVNFVKTSTSTVTVSTGTVTGGGSGSISGTISGVATGTAIIATVTETGCSVQNITINAPSNTAPALTASNAVCSGTGTYSVSFSSNGIVTASAGTVSGNSVTGIPVGTNVTLTARSTNGCGTTTAVVPSPASCPASNGCTPPALTAGQGVCSGSGNYAVVFSTTPGASIAISSGTLTGNTITGVTVGTSLTITATLGGCSSVVIVNSPIDCSTACSTPAASFSAGACTGATYTVNFAKTSSSVITASIGTVTGGGSGTTSGTISGVATGTAIIATITEPGCSVQFVTISAPSTVAPILTTSNAVCNGAGTYSVSFSSNGIVSATAGTVSGSSVTGIPVGTNVMLTAKSTTNCATTVAVVTSPVNCPVSNTCTPPALSAGNGVCSGGGFYSVAFSADPGSSVSTSAGIINGNSIDNIPVGTNVVITATAAVGGCTTVLQVNSPSDCSTVCNTTAVSFTRPVSNGATYSVSFSKRSSTIVNSSAGIVTGGTSGSTVGTITGIPVGVNITVTAADPSCSTNSYVISSPALGVVVSAKVFLQGAMSGATMRTTLRNNSLIPLSQPYNGSPWNYAGAESVGSVAAMPANLADWVLVELRDASSPSTVIATRAAFLLSNGDIVDMDGISALSFPTVGEGSYFIAVRHRNHMSIRTAAAQGLKATGTQYDFTTAQVAAYQNPVVLSNGGANNGNAAMKDLGSGIYAMWGGNSNSNNSVRFSGPSNDLATLLSALTGVQSSTLNGVYNNADMNMDGNVRYSGPGNDYAFLLAVLSGNQALILTQH